MGAWAWLSQQSGSGKVYRRWWVSQGGLGCLGNEHTIHYEHLVEMKSLWCVLSGAPWVCICYMNVLKHLKLSRSLSDLGWKHQWVSVSLYNCIYRWHMFYILYDFFLTRKTWLYNTRVCVNTQRTHTHPYNLFTPPSPSRHPTTTTPVHRPTSQQRAHPQSTVTKGKSWVEDIRPPLAARVGPVQCFLQRTAVWAKPPLSVCSL